MRAWTVFLSTLVATGFLSSIVSVRAAGPYDGQWLLTITTQNSYCNPVYHWRVTIADGKASGRAQGRWGEYLFNGSIDANGRIAIGYRHLSDPRGGSITGQVDRNGGASGTWFGSGEGVSCAGPFTGRRAR